MDKEISFFEFLEKKKVNLYKIENKGIQYKTTTAQLKLLKGIYKFWNFNFLSVAYLNPKEKEEWYKYKKIISSKEKETDCIDAIKTVFERLKKYDILKIEENYYNIKHSK